jgi:signal transduction histidine kinase
MFSTNLSEAVERLLFLYIAEVILGLILFFIFRHFGNLYRRRFLYTWSLSWLAFSFNIIFTGIVIILSGQSQSVGRIGLSIFAQLACFLQIIYLLRGTYELVYERSFNKKRFRTILIATFFIALIIVLVFGQDPDYGFLRHLLRVGSRTLVTGIGFLITGLVCWYNRKFTKGFGQRLLAASFLVYSVYQLYSFIIVMLNVADPYWYTPGVTDLLLIAVIGMSMVMWLLEDEQEKLEKANQELDQFLYSTSHDLRAPIASILGLTYLGKLEFEEEKARTFMDMIETRIKKLDLIIGDILNLSRSKKIDVRIEELDLKEMIDNTVMDIKFNKGASAISLDYKHDPSHVFKSDFNQVKIILNNLMGNAVKYHNINQENPYIRVTFFRKKDAVEIGIEDNGQGIPEDSLPKIFDMFFRASPTTEGTGLGLYIVREALTKINGNIEVKSRYGKGSVFTIILTDA